MSQVHWHKYTLANTIPGKKKSRIRIYGNH